MAKKGVRLAANYWRKRCLRYKATPGRVVYEEDADAAKKLLNRRQYFDIGQSRGGRDTHGGGTGKHVTVAGYLPNCWRKLDVKATSRSLRNALLFLHELRTPLGQRQLVSVSYSYLLHHRGAVLMGKTGKDGFGDIRVPPQFQVMIYDTGSWSRPPRCLSTDHFAGISDHDPFDVKRTVRFYAGQLDPKDRSRFTIEYEVEGVRGRTRWQLVDLTNEEKPSRLCRSIVQFEREGPSR